jgi:hypothetical protein
MPETIELKHLRDILNGMLARCNNPRNKKYSAYGKRGITVCDEWAHDKAAFFRWALSHGYKAGLSIDRIDNDRGYSPDNCQWLTVSENASKGGMGLNEFRLRKALRVIIKPIVFRRIKWRNPRLS